MSVAHPAPPLLGRRSERAALDGLLSSVRAGSSQSLVVRGEPGVGKSALLEYVAEHATGCRIVQAIGVESEMDGILLLVACGGGGDDDNSTTSASTNCSSGIARLT